LAMIGMLRLMRKLLLVVSLVLVVVGCNNGSKNTSDTDGGTSAGNTTSTNNSTDNAGDGSNADGNLNGTTEGDSVASHTPGLQNKRTIRVDGLARRYQVFLPNDLNLAQTVLLLHGNRGSSDQLLGLQGTKSPFKIWMDIALRENLILIVPDGEEGDEGFQGWNDCRTDAPNNPNTDDVKFLSTLIDSVTTEFNTNEQAVFVAGISNGGMMSMRLADEAPDRLRAFASVVASRPLNTQCADATTPISVLIMNGTADPILPYEGGHIKPRRGELFSTNDLVSYWVNRNQANTVNNVVVLEDRNTRDNSNINLSSYTGGANNTQVHLYEVVGGGHTEPSLAEHYGLIYKRIVGEQNRDIEMAEEIWAFFAGL